MEGIQLAGRFTAGVATGIAIVSLSGVVALAAHTLPTSAAGPSGATAGSASHAHATAKLAGNKTVNRGARWSVTATQQPGEGGVIMDGKWVVTVVAVNGQTITATLNSPIALAFGVGGGATLNAMPGPPGPLPPAGSAPRIKWRLHPEPLGPLPSIMPGNPVTATITVSGSTTYTRAGKPASLSDVTAGSVLAVEGTPSSDTSFAATSIEIVLPHREGVVTAISGNNLTVTGFDARVYTISVDANTGYARAGKTATLSDIAIGSLIDAEGTVGSAPSILSALAITIELPRVAGKVTAITGDTVTVSGPDGTNSTIHLSSVTTYHAGKQSAATRSDVTVGSFVEAQGTVEADGTLDALDVIVLPAPDQITGFGPGVPPAPPGSRDSAKVFGPFNSIENMSSGGDTGNSLSTSV